MPTWSAWVRAMAALLACVRGIERDPCLGEWVGLRREAHADLMCVCVFGAGRGGLTIAKLCSHLVQRHCGMNAGRLKIFTGSRPRKRDLVRLRWCRKVTQLRRRERSYPGEAVTTIAAAGEGGRPHCPARCWNNGPRKDGSRWFLRAGIMSPAEAQ